MPGVGYGFEIDWLEHASRAVGEGLRFLFAV